MGVMSTYPDPDDLQAGRRAGSSLDSSAVTQLEERPRDARTRSRLPPPRPDCGVVTEPASLTHLDRSGAARMVDVSAKESSIRRAVATGKVRTTAEVAALLVGEGLPKGDALAVSRIAGLMGAKRTADLIPLCHPIAITGITVDLRVDAAGVVDITATVKTTDRTGVEMEALTAVAVSGLALHDMIKAVDPAAVLTDVRVERKEGGKTGEWTRPADLS